MNNQPRPWQPLLCIALSTVLWIFGLMYLGLAAIGLFFFIGGLRSLWRFCLPESQRHRTFFHGIGLVTITLAGSFFAVSGVWLFLRAWGT